MAESSETLSLKEFQFHDKDTGSADVQVALLTRRIEQLTEHLKTNRKDQSSRHGLHEMVAQRRSLLDYLINTKARPKLGPIKSLSKPARSPDLPTGRSSSHAVTPWCWPVPSRPQLSKKVRIISRLQSIIAKKRQPWGNFPVAISSAKGVLRK